MAPSILKGRNYLQYDRVKLAAYHSVSNKLGEFVAEWKAAFHGMNVMAIKDKEVAAVGAWGKLQIAEEMVKLNFGKY